MKLVLFAILAVAVAFGYAEAVRLYGDVETNDERFFGMVVLIMPLMAFMVLAVAHGLLFPQRGAVR